MNEFRGIVESQVDSLTGAVRAQKDSRCRRIVHEAKERADALVKQSRREARKRVHEAVIEERKRRETALVQVRHRLETAARRRIQARYDELLGQAWPRLIRELECRWERPEDRRDWCAMLVDEAAALFANDAWRIAHPDPASGRWSADDATMLSATVTAHGVAAPEFVAAADLLAGLRIRRGGACLDGSIAGLLARRRAVEGRLLACWESGAERARASDD